MSVETHTLEREMWLPQEWHIPSLDEEFGELERTAKGLDIPIDTLTEAFEHGQMMQLTHDTWTTIRNCDSRDEGWTDIDEIKEHLSTRKKQPRDVTPIVTAMQHNEPLPAPIVLRRNDELYLVAGNSRLLAARALKRDPKVFVIDVEK